jgi:hypothetical protein
MSISAASAYADPPISAAQQKADAQKLAAQYAQRTAQGTAEATAQAVGRTIKTDAAKQGLHITAANVTAAINTVVAQTQALAGGTATGPFLQVPTSIAAQKADAQKLAPTYQSLTSHGDAEQAVTGVAGTLRQDAISQGVNLTLSGVTTAVARAADQTSLSLVG